VPLGHGVPDDVRDGVRRRRVVRVRGRCRRGSRGGYREPQHRQGDPCYEGSPPSPNPSPAAHRHETLLWVLGTVRGSRPGGSRPGVWHRRSSTRKSARPRSVLERCLPTGPRRSRPAPVAVRGYRPEL
jgi:hypothetical protein